LVARLCRPARSGHFAAAEGVGWTALRSITCGCVRSGSAAAS